MGGACQAMRPQADAGFDQRIRFDGVALHDGTARLPCASVDDALALVQARPQGRLLVRGSNGSGKSTLLAALKGRLGVDAFYWPTSDKLAFAFAAAQAADEIVDEAEAAPAGTGNYAGFSSGEKQLKSLAEIASRTQARVYLLDEWDANLDAKNRASAEQLVATLATRALVVEISPRDRG
jgi:ABC-type cobalamin/Fe3+-siderophores transport system ATPase subunit